MTPEIVQILSEVRRFCRKEIAPFALEADLERDHEWLIKVWDKSTEMDLPGLILPQEPEAQGYSPYTALFVVDQISRFCPGVASLFLHHYAACYSLLQADTEVAREVTGKNGLPLALAFPTHREVIPIRVSEEDDLPRVNGVVPLAQNLAFDGDMVIFAQNADHSVIQAVLPSHGSGITKGEDAELPGLCVNPFFRVSFSDAPAKCIGRKKKDAVYRETLDFYHALVAAACTGAARHAYEKAVEHAKTRYQFGKNIIAHQEIKRILGTMAMNIQTSTAAYLSALPMDPGHGQTGFPGWPQNPGLLRVHAAQSCLSVSQDAIQVLGGYGYMHEYGLEKIMRDIRVLGLLGETGPETLIRYMDAPKNS